MTLDYNLFDNLTIKQASNIYDFFPDRDDILANEESDYITYYIDHHKAEYGVIYSGDLERIINTWELEEKTLELSIKELNDSLIIAFEELDCKFLEDDHFEEFLKDLDIEFFHNRVEISSYRSSYKCCCFVYDYLSEAVDSYLQEIVEQKDVTFLDFEVGDEFYWCCLCENFDYPPEDDEDQEENENIDK